MVKVNEMVQRQHREIQDKVMDIATERMVSALRSGTRLVPSGLAPKPCLCCQKQTTGVVTPRGDHWTRLCPDCKKLHDSQADAALSALARVGGDVTDGVEVAMAVEATAPETWTGNELGVVLPRPVGRTKTVTMEFDGITLDVEVEYAIEDRYDFDGEKVIGKQAVARRIVPTADCPKKIADQIDLNDDRIIDALAGVS